MWYNFFLGPNPNRALLAKHQNELMKEQKRSRVSTKVNDEKDKKYPKSNDHEDHIYDSTDHEESSL